MKKIMVGLCLAAVMAGPALALDMTPLQIGFGGANAQLFPPETTVIGLRLNLVASENHDMMGIDVGIWSKAIQMDAFQVNLVNLVETEFDGISVGLLSQMGAASGVQVGLVNLVRYDINGVQAGLFNRADDVNGIQIGLINRTVSLRGIQVGLVNLLVEGPLTFFPIINAAF
ncbi:MAG: hypothetical protein PHO14_07615 [Kiritimatiellae bacterium]|nr:hypothetical protein [Kiritimatiellia bacterium]